MSIRTAQGAIGRILIAAGVVLRLFVAPAVGHRATRRAGPGPPRGGLPTNPRHRPATTTTTAPPQPGATATLPPSTVPALAEEEVPDPGHAARRIEIPAIGLRLDLRPRRDSAHLKNGPGRYPDTPMPGLAGNAAPAGQRTTYGAPFNRIDELTAGDEIVINHRPRAIPLRGGRAAHHGPLAGRGHPAHPRTEHRDTHLVPPEVLRPRAHHRRR